MPQIQEANIIVLAAELGEINVILGVWALTAFQIVKSSRCSWVDSKVHLRPSLDENHAINLITTTGIGGSLLIILS